MLRTTVPKLIDFCVHDGQGSVKCRICSDASIEHKGWAGLSGFYAHLKAKHPEKRRRLNPPGQPGSRSPSPHEGLAAPSASPPVDDTSSPSPTPGTHSQRETTSGSTARNDDQLDTSGMDVDRTCECTGESDWEGLDPHCDLPQGALAVGDTGDDGDDIWYNCQDDEYGLDEQADDGLDGDGDLSGDREGETGGSETPLHDEDAATADAGTKVGSLQWWHSRAQLPVFPGATLTVKEVCWLQLSKKTKTGQHDDDFAADQCFMRHLLSGLYPDGHILWPPSAHIMKGILFPTLQDLSWAEYEYHCCDNPRCPGHVFDQISKDEWAAHQDDACPHCHTPRFLQLGAHPSTWRPTAWFLYFGLEAVIRIQFWANPRFTKLLPTVGEPRAAYFSYPEYQRLAAAIGEWLRDPQMCGVYEIGIDWIQPFTSCTHSTGVVLVRNKELPDGLVARGDNCAVLMLLPGPKEHRNMNSVFKLVAQDLARLRTSGMQVRRHQEGPDGSVVISEPFTHRVALGAVHADSPARCKVAYALGIAAFLCCYWCKLQAVRAPSGYEGQGAATQYMKSYVVATTRRYGTGSQQLGDEGLKHTDAEQRARGTEAADAAHNQSMPQSRVTALHSHLGSKGISVLLTVLPYLSPNNLFLVPVAHALYYGVVKAFVDFALRPVQDDSSCPDDAISKSARVEIARRAGHVRLPSDFGRNYRCILSYRGSWRMEDWQHFLESISLYIFSGDVLPDKLHTIWIKLRQASVHFTRPPADNQAGPGSGGQAAFDLLREVGELYEEYGFPDCMFTFNLHLLACRLLDQEKARGPVCVDLEYWVERGIRWFKKYCQGRVSAGPEKAYANFLLLQQALAAAAVQSPRMAALQRWLESGFRDQVERGEHYDDGPGGLFLGAGRSVARQHKALVLASVLQYLDDMHPAGWSEGDVRAAFQASSKLVHTYKRSSVRDEELVSIYDASRSLRARQNCWVLVDWHGQPYVCMILSLVRVIHPQAAEQQRAQAEELAELQAAQARHLQVKRAAHQQQLLQQGSNTSQTRAACRAQQAAEVEALKQAHAAALDAVAVQHAADAVAQPLRLAICKVYNHDEVHAAGTCLYTAATVNEARYPVDLDSIECKLMAFSNPDGEQQFAKFHNLSKAF